MLHGENDGVEPPASSENQKAMFTGGYERRVLPGIEHNVPQEAPGELVRAISAVA